MKAVFKTAFLALLLVGSALAQVPSSYVNAAAGGGGGSSSPPIEFIAATCQGTTAAGGFAQPTANPPEALCVTGTNTNFGVLAFDPTTSESVQDRFRMTELPSSMDAVVEWRTGATSGNVVWGLAGICVADGESLDTAFATEQLFTADAAQGVAETKNSTATLTGVTIASCAAGETYMFELRRASDEAGDTINSDDVDLISLTFVKTNAQDPTNSSSRFAGMVCVGAAPLPSRSRRATAVPHTSLLDEGAEVIYRFTDGSGTQISDSSGNDRHWTIGSPGPSWQTDPPHISFTGAAAPTETITSSHGHKATDGDFTWIGLMRSPIVESGPGDQIYVFEGQYLFGGGVQFINTTDSSGSFAVVIKNAEIHLNGLARSTAGVLNDEWWFFAIVVQANPANSTLRINETVSVGTPSASAMVEATGGLAAGSDGLIFGHPTT